MARQPKGPEKDGTLLIDRTFPPPVGALRFRSGTHHDATRDGISRMLTALWEVGRHDVLTAFKRRQLTPLVVYGDWRSAKFSAAYLERMPGAEVLTPLAGAWERWAAGYERAGDEHRRQIGHCLTRLLLSAPLVHAPSVADLPDLLAAYRVRAKDLGTARAFNLTKAAAQAFARSTLKRSHPVYLAVQDVERLPVTATRAHRPFTVADYDRLVGALLEEGQWPERDAQAAAIARAMATTGMGPKEMWGAWEVRPASVHVEGTKRRGRVRDVPRVLDAACYAAARTATASMSRKAWEQRFQRAVAKADLAPRVVYDLRRTFAHWMEEAGITRARRIAYMGHGAGGDTTALYERHEVQTFLADDAERVRAYIERERAAAGKGIHIVREDQA